MLTVTKKWGFEIWIENNDMYCGKQLTVLPGRKCSVHYHKIKDETFYVLDGELLVEYVDMRSDHYNDEESWDYFRQVLILKRGDSFRIKPYTMHRFTSNTNYPCTFIEFSTTHSDEDSYRIIESQ